MRQDEEAVVTRPRLLCLDIAIFTKVAFGFSSVCNLELVLKSCTMGLRANPWCRFQLEINKEDKVGSKKS